MENKLGPLFLNLEQILRLFQFSSSQAKWTEEQEFLPQTYKQNSSLSTSLYAHLIQNKWPKY